jgi:type IV secretory pathway component VirB8
MKKPTPITKQSSSGAQPPDFAPGPLSKDTALEHFERGARPSLERNRWFLIALILATGHVFNGIGWNIALPLKTIETFQVNKAEGGRLVADGTPVGAWVPDSDSIMYFLNQWATNVFVVDRANIEGTLTAAGERVTGAAKAQLGEMRRKDNPLVALRDYPQYSRGYEFITLNFVKDDVALLRFRTIERLSPESKPKIVTYAMTISFTRVKPTTRADVMKNPAGLFVTNFNLTEESVSQ